MRSKIPISVRFRSGTGKVIRMNKNFTEDTFGQRIKAARVSKGLTQEELAEIMYIPKSTISAYENDKVDAKKSTIEGLIKTLDKDANYFYGIEQKVNPRVQRLSELADEIEDDDDWEMLLMMAEAMAKKSRKRKKGRVNL